MSRCSGITKSGSNCSRSVKEGEFYCWQHKDKTVNKINQLEIKKVSGGRSIGDLNIFDSNDPQAWEDEYQRVMDPKYKKNTRNFNRKITGKVWTGEDEPPIFLIPRERGGPSYKDVKLEGVKADDVQYILASKGYPGQDVSSFTLGPFPGHGLCLVNAAFSKSICLFHLTGGYFDPKRKNFWNSPRKPIRNIKLTNLETIEDDKIVPMIEVDGNIYDTIKWLETNKKLWYHQWKLWSQSIALCSMGDFHWTDKSPVVVYYHKEQYLDFVSWKKECYIKPSYSLLPETSVFQFLLEVWKEKKVPLALVHPMAITGQVEVPITREYIRTLYDSPVEMCCQPFVVAALLLGVEP